MAVTTCFICHNKGRDFRFVEPADGEPAVPVCREPAGCIERLIASVPLAPDRPAAD